MSAYFLLKGLLTGFIIAAPVGPIGLLCIRRSLTQGKTYGFVTGLGAASADGLYAFIGAYGLTYITSFLINQSNWIRIVGGCFLCYLGIQTLRKRPKDHGPNVNKAGLLEAYASTFALTITNPTTILSFVGIFAGLGFSSAQNRPGFSLSLVAGVLGGSALWWLVLSSSVSLARKKLNAGVMIWINRISGIIVTGYGVAALYNAVV